MPQDPFIKCFCLFTCTSGLIEGRIIFVVVDYFGTLRVHHIAPFFQKFPGGGGGHAPRPPSTSVIPHPYRATCALSLVDSLIFIKTLKDADQIVKRLCTVTKIKCFHFL